MAKGFVTLPLLASLILAGTLLPSPRAFAQTPAAAVIELRAGAATPKGGSEADAVDRFAELVAQKTKGAVKVINLYTALGVEQQLAQQVMTGSVDIGTMSTGNFSRWTNALLPWDLPFLFKSYEAALLSFEAPIARDAIGKVETVLGVKFLFPISIGSGRDIQTRSKALRTPADIKGLKIRVVSTPIDLATFKAWGANPTPVDWGQTYTALQQGVVDGENITTASTFTAKHYEVVKHVIRLNYQPLIELCFINARKFASFSPEHQKAVLEAAREAGAWNRQHESERQKSVEKALREHGVTVYTPTPQEYAQWTAIRDEVWQGVSKEMPGKIDFELAKRLSQFEK